MDADLLRDAICAIVHDQPIEWSVILEQPISRVLVRSIGAEQRIWNTEDRR